MLKRENACLVIIDVQGKLATLMHDAETVFRNLERIVMGCRVLDIPVIWMEQNPVGLGPTIPEIARHLSGQTPLCKTCFSCCGSEAFLDSIRQSGRQDILIAGIEAHICVYQTALDLLGDGYGVHVITDAVSSRTVSNRDLAMTRMAAAGAELTSVEMCLFEMLRIGEGSDFRSILKIIK
ncbi:hydrolase [bacterium]|nr:hydrolase [candidate division CSSED10-310 bacterium]